MVGAERESKAALRLAGCGDVFRFKLDEVLNGNRLEERADAEVRAMLAIPGREPVIDEPDEPLPELPTTPVLSLVCTTPSVSVEQAITGYRLGAYQESSTDEYHEASAAIYAARTMAKAA